MMMNADEEDVEAERWIWADVFMMYLGYDGKLKEADWNNRLKVQGMALHGDHQESEMAE